MGGSSVMVSAVATAPSEITAVCAAGSPTERLAVPGSSSAPVTWSTSLSPFKGGAVSGGEGYGEAALRRDLLLRRERITTSAADFPTAIVPVSTFAVESVALVPPMVMALLLMSVAGTKAACKVAEREGEALGRALHRRVDLNDDCQRLAIGEIHREVVASPGGDILGVPVTCLG